MMRRFWMTPVLFGMAALVAGAGCGSNPILLMSYLFNNNDPKMPAKFPLKPRPKHEKEDVRVVVMTSCVPGISPDMMGVERALAAEFVNLLQERCTENKEKVAVLRAPIVDKFKRENPTWRIMPPDEIGKKLDTDYIIDIQVVDISLYERATGQEFMRGRARIKVEVFDLSKKFQEPAFSEPEYNIVYPRGYEVSKFDEHPSAFKQKFINRIANELVLPFSAHTSKQNVSVD